MECMPGQGNPKEKLNAIEGYVPHPSDFPKGCAEPGACAALCSPWLTSSMRWGAVLCPENSMGTKMYTLARNAGQGK